MFMSLQTGREQAWAELAGVPMTGYNDVFMKFSTAEGYTGTFNDRMVQYLRSINPGFNSYNLPDLERATAVQLGVSSWNEVGYAIKTLSGPPPSWTPQQLFGGGELGGWYDPSDLSTMFTDDAGTIPVTAAGQTVRRINDKSGNGLHLSSDALNTGRVAPTYQTAGGVHWLQAIDDSSGLSSSLGSSPYGDFPLETSLTLAAACAGTNVLQTANSILNVRTTALAAGANFASLGRNGVNSAGFGSVQGANMTPTYAGVTSTTANGSAPQNVPYRSVAVFIPLDAGVAINNSIVGSNVITGWDVQTAAGQISYAGEGIAAKTYGMVCINRVLTTQELADLDTWLQGQYT